MDNPFFCAMCCVGYRKRLIESDPAASSAEWNAQSGLRATTSLTAVSVCPAVLL
jgi:hypothetical protein